LHLSAQDLKYASSTIQADLDRFQRQKVADLREMATSLARSHRDWCKKVWCNSYLYPSLADVHIQNLAAWKEAKKEIDKIPDHPNHPGTQDSAATINGR